MVIVPPIPFRGRRRRILPTPPAPALPLNIVLAELMSATDDDAEVRVTFDTSEENPLVDILSADAAKWWCRVNGIRFVGSAVAPVDFEQIRVFFVAAEMEAGAQVIDYTNSPSDIADASGRKLAAIEVEIIS